MRDLLRQNLKSSTMFKSQQTMSNFGIGTSGSTRCVFNIEVLFACVARAVRKVRGVPYPPYPRKPSDHSHQLVIGVVVSRFVVPIILKTHLIEGLMPVKSVVAQRMECQLRCYPHHLTVYQNYKIHCGSP
ncbi:hypothetical protein TNCV_2684021 [Trichonephila clavipes]|nr:hypothetical protein TNCV_2684021 [Trichonephila clavipes]